MPDVREGVGAGGGGVKYETEWSRGGRILMDGAEPNGRGKRHRSTEGWRASRRNPRLPPRLQVPRRRARPVRRVRPLHGSRDDHRRRRATGPARVRRRAFAGSTWRSLWSGWLAWGWSHRCKHRTKYRRMWQTIRTSNRPGRKASQATPQATREGDASPIACWRFSTRNRQILRS